MEYSVLLSMKAVGCSNSTNSVVVLLEETEALINDNSQDRVIGE